MNYRLSVEYHENFKLEEKLQEEMTQLPQTPFFIRDNTDWDKPIYMVVPYKERTGLYLCVNIEDGYIPLEIKEGEVSLLERINEGYDSLLESHLVLKKY